MNKFKIHFDFKNVPDECPVDVIKQVLSETIEKIPDKYFKNAQTYKMTFYKFEKQNIQ